MSGENRVAQYFKDGQVVPPSQPPKPGPAQPSSVQPPNSVAPQQSTSSATNNPPPAGETPAQAFERHMQAEEGTTAAEQQRALHADPATSDLESIQKAITEVVNGLQGAMQETASPFASFDPFASFFGPPLMAPFFGPNPLMQVSGKLQELSGLFNSMNEKNKANVGSAYDQLLASFKANPQISSPKLTEQVFYESVAGLLEAIGSDQAARSQLLDKLSADPGAREKLTSYVAAKVSAALFEAQVREVSGEGASLQLTAMGLYGNETQDLADVLGYIMSSSPELKQQEDVMKTGLEKVMEAFSNLAQAAVKAREAVGKRPDLGFAGRVKLAKESLGDLSPRALGSVRELLGSALELLKRAPDSTAAMALNIAGHAPRQPAVVAGAPQGPTDILNN